jgi:hypothetical protein
MARTRPGEWFVLRTKARQERILAKELNGVGITAYLLVIRETRDYAQRKVDVEVPLFGRVVFLYGTMDDIRFAKSTGRVTSATRAVDQVGLHADFDLLAETLPAGMHESSHAAGEADAGVRDKLSPTLEMHRDVIFRLKRQLDAPPESMTWQ